MYHDQSFRYLLRHLKINYIDILSGVLQELSLFSDEVFTVIYLTILSGVSRQTLLISSMKSHDKPYRHSVLRFQFNYVYTLLEDSWWMFSIVFGRLTINYLQVIYAIWQASVFELSPYLFSYFEVIILEGEISQYFFGRYTVLPRSHSETLYLALLCVF